MKKRKIEEVLDTLEESLDEEYSPVIGYDLETNDRLLVGRRAMRVTLQRVREALGLYDGPF